MPENILYFPSTSQFCARNLEWLQCNWQLVKFTKPQKSLHSNCTCLHFKPPTHVVFMAPACTRQQLSFLSSNECHPQFLFTRITNSHLQSVQDTFVEMIFLCTPPPNVSDSSDTDWCMTFRNPLKSTLRWLEEICGHNRQARLWENVYFACLHIACNWNWQESLRHATHRILWHANSKQCLEKWSPQTLPFNIL